jgi:hypothetical protein
MAARSAFLERLRVRGRQTRERALVVVADLSDEQLSWRPRPTAHSIAYTLWHIARTEDNFQNDVNRRGTVWSTADFAAKWGYPEKGVGAGWADERAASLPMPGKSQLLEYVKAVFAACDEAADTLDETLLNEVRQSGFLGKEEVLGEVLLGSITHANRHLGEMEYIKGLLGLRGSSTY